MPSMQQKLADQIRANEESFQTIFTALDAGESHEGQDPMDSLHEEPLEVALQRQVTIVLTTGGPHVEIVAALDAEGNTTRASWHSYWGGETVEKVIGSDEAAYRAIEYFVEGVLVA
ncbi:MULTISPECIES: hypothetical protein [Micrococcales]|uniref:Uncharacterized protein n=1 Tax=Brevibacterium aurantiacum TaxID=273384 RepID=A0A2H1KYZ4_BREAU|nr:hypothetical protein [Brevibacterium aurantiacum]TGD38187.1 hypothetical protein EB834_11850 [Brevibacterium aurantiacum]SMY04993.1 hypothetical protein BAURA86_03906 [Brevibacterium aurantiacum]